MATSMITATTWVPRGFAAQHPRRVEIDEKEFDRIAEIAKLQLEDAKQDLEEIRQTEADAMDTEDDGEGAKEEARATTAPAGKAPAQNGGAKMDEDKDGDDDLRQYDLEHYDDEEEEARSDGEPMGMFGNVKDLAYYQPGEKDPYITLQDNEDDEEREELEILPTDNLLLVGRVEDEVAHLEIYVYEDEADNLYVHHDIMLPAIPLCLEWLDIPVGSAVTDKSARGNYVAVGTTSPEIEIWDLDVVDSMFPNAILGADHNNSSSSKKKKKKKKNKANDSCHTDAVQALAGNRQHRNLLASASADKTVKLWDLRTQQCASSYGYHTDQVCALAWHAAAHGGATLLSGSYDRSVVWADVRAPGAQPLRWGVESDVEDVRWDPHDANYFYVSTEAGMVHFHDARNAPATPAATKPVWTLQAHDKAVSSFDVNPVVPGFLATGSMDKSVKLWNTRSASGGPTMVVSRDPAVGKVFSTRFAPDDGVGFRLAVAGSKGVVTVWDTSTNAGVRSAFGDRVKVVPAAEGKEDRVVAVEDSGDESESDEEDGEGGPGAGAGAGAKEGWESMDDDDEI